MTKSIVFRLLGQKEKPTNYFDDHERPSFLDPSPAPLMAVSDAFFFFFSKTGQSSADHQLKYTVVL